MIISRYTRRRLHRKAQKDGSYQLQKGWKSPQPAIERIHKRYKKDGHCWIWLGKVSRDGAPRVRVFNNTRSVRAVLYEELTAQPFPKGQRTTTICGNALCVNPKHCLLSSIIFGAKIIRDPLESLMI